MAGKKKKNLHQAKARWEETVYKPSLSKKSDRKKRFRNLSQEEIRSLYTPLDLSGLDYIRDIGFPGEFPFTRGVYPNLYRSRLWTMRQFSGFGSAEETNRRFRYLLANGGTGLSIAFDMPTLMGFDSDHPNSAGEIGKCGVAVDSLSDMEFLFEEIPLDQVSVSMTINGPAVILFAMYLAVAEKQGHPFSALKGTLQNDILKEYIAQKEWICPPLPSLRLISDLLKYCVEHVPQYHPISISGYHIREAGSTAVQELAFTLYDGLTYVASGLAAGLQVDRFAPRLSFFFNSHNDFFEEIAKFRAARRLWAREMKKRFSPRDLKSLALRFHAQTAGCTLTAQQPANNVVRVTLQAMAAVLGGAQSIHTNSMDETLALPSEEAVKVALRTQQIIAHESGVSDTVDPLGGGYYIESLTQTMEDRAKVYFDQLDAMGGMVRAIESGFPQKEIHRASLEYQREVERGDRVVVGVNRFSDQRKQSISILKISDEVGKRQVDRLKKVREKRAEKKVKKALSRLTHSLEAGDNSVPFVLEAVRAYATVGEISDLFRRVLGEYRETAHF